MEDVGSQSIRLPSLEHTQQNLKETPAATSLPSVPIRIVYYKPCRHLRKMPLTRFAALGLRALSALTQPRTVSFSLKPYLDPHGFL